MRLWLTPRDVEGSELVRTAWCDLQSALAWHMRVEGLTIEHMELRTGSGTLVSILNGHDERRAAEDRRWEARLRELAEAERQHLDRERAARQAAETRARGARRA